MNTRHTNTDNRNTRLLRRENKAEGPLPATNSSLATNPKGCACGGGCPRCTSASSHSPSNGQSLPASLRSRVEQTQNADFSEVRVHPAALDVTTPLQARAVTRGQDIYFHPGQFRPDTPQGQQLIAHELAHTQQTRRAVSGRRTGSSADLERNADDLAAGRATPVLAAPSAAALPDRFPGEEWHEEVRRLAALDHYRRLVPQLQTAIDAQSLLPSERARARGRIEQMFSGTIYSQDQRNAIVVRLIEHLRRLIAQLETSAVPESWYAPASAEYSMSAADSRGTDDDVEERGDASITDAVMFHVHWCAAHQAPVAEMQEENYYVFALLSLASTDAPATGPVDAPEVQTPPDTSSGMHPHAMPPSTGTGYWIVVPHPVQAPQTYHYYSSSAWVPRGGLVVEVMRDVVGYFYVNRSQRVYIPSPMR